MGEVEGRLVRRLVSRHPSDAARVVERYPAAEAARYVAALPPREAAPLLASMTAPAAGALLAASGEEAAAELVSALPPFAAALMMGMLGAEERSGILSRVDEELRGLLVARIDHPSGSAGALADPHVLALPAEATTAEAIEAVRAGSGNAPEYVFAVERPATLVGQVSTADLLRRDPASPIGDAVIRPAAAIHARAGLRSIATHPAWRGLHVLPVVDADGLLVGSLSIGELRLLARPPVGAGDLVSAAMNLSELYWHGLGGALGGLGALVPRRRERDGGARRGGR